MSGSDEKSQKIEPSSSAEKLTQAQESSSELDDAAHAGEGSQESAAQGTITRQGGERLPTTLPIEDAGRSVVTRDGPQAGKWDAVRRLWNWKPRPARYDAENPPEFTIWLNMLFGFVSRHLFYSRRRSRSGREVRWTLPGNPSTDPLQTPRSQASCFTVSNLYYNQAILNRIAETFNVSFEKASSVATLMQAGYASGLLLICPLGDIFPRRPFIIGLVAFTATLVNTYLPP